MKTADSRPSLFQTLVRKGFGFLLARVHRSRFAALGAAAMALLFARHLVARTQSTSSRNTAPSGHVYEGEFRRIRESR